MGRTQFYRCQGCGNFVAFIGSKTSCTPKCCGEHMKELVPNSVDAAKEKHVPDVTVAGSRVIAKVGTAAHPMIDEHHIEFIYLETEKGGQMHYLKPGEEPIAEFEVTEGDKPVAVYAYCNLHGLWENDLRKQSDKKGKLVAYFSVGTGLDKLAAEIGEITGADIYEIVPATPYTAEDLDWTDGSSRSNVEMMDDGIRPAMADKKDISDYDTIYIGFPIWWDKAPRIINTFLESASFEGKTIVPFCISGGSKADVIDAEFAKYAPKGSTVKKAKLLNGKPSKEEIADWIKSL